MKQSFTLFGKAASGGFKHGSRHRRSQMKYFSGRGFKAVSALKVQMMFPNFKLK